jgi:hypothetical protein
MKVVGIIRVDFGIIDLLLPRHSVFVRLEKVWEYDETTHQIFINFEKAYISVRLEVIDKVLIEFDTPMQVFRPIKIYYIKPTVKYVKINTYMKHLLFTMV